MSRRSTSRHRRHRARLAVIVALSAVAIGVYLWRARRESYPAAASPQAPDRMPPTAARGGEDFSAAERQGLENVLKGRAGKQQ